MYTKYLRDRVTSIIDTGFVGHLKAGRIRIVQAVTAFDECGVVCKDGSRLEPDALIACTGYRCALEPLVGHLGLLDERGGPIIHGPQTHPQAPHLYFIGYSHPFTGNIRQIAHDARQIGKQVGASLSAARPTGSAAPARQGQRASDDRPRDPAGRWWPPPAPVPTGEDAASPPTR